MHKFLIRRNKAYELQKPLSESWLWTIRQLKYQRFIDYEHTKMAYITPAHLLHLRL